MYAAHFYREERGAPSTYENDGALRSGHVKYRTVREIWVCPESPRRQHFPSNRKARANIDVSRSNPIRASAQRASGLRSSTDGRSWSPNSFRGSALSPLPCRGLRAWLGGNFWRPTGPEFFYGPELTWESAIFSASSWRTSGG